MSEHPDDSILRGLFGETLRGSPRRKPSVRRVETRNKPREFETVCAWCVNQKRQAPFRFVARTAFYGCKLLREHLEKDHGELECYFCYLKFASFAELAEHVNVAHTEPGKRVPEELPDWARGESDMSLPAPNAGRTQNQRDGGGRRSTSGPKFQFIKIEDVPQGEPEPAKIIATSTQNTGFNDIVLKIEFRNKRYFFGLKSSNENYEKMFRAWGDDDKDWVGKSFTLGQNYNEFHDKNFLHVFALLDESGKPEKKARKKKAN